MSLEPGRIAGPRAGVARRVGHQVRRRPGLLIGVGALLVAGTVPLVAFVIVPLFVQKQVQEAFPAVTAAPSAAAVSPAPTATAAPGGTRTVAQGQLQRLDPVHFGTGTVLIADANGTRYLRFEDVTIAAAPDMYVYLSDRTDGKPGSFVDLGKLKGTSGSFNYVLPPSVDLATVNSVVVWCRPFSVTVTFAPLHRQ